MQMWSSWQFQACPSLHGLEGTKLHGQVLSSRAWGQLHPGVQACSRPCYHPRPEVHSVASAPHLNCLLNSIPKPQPQRCVVLRSGYLRQAAFLGFMPRPHVLLSVLLSALRRAPGDCCHGAAHDASPLILVNPATRIDARCVPGSVV